MDQDNTATTLSGCADSITVLRAHGRRLAKLVSRNGRFFDYDSAFRFDCATLPLNDLRNLWYALHRLLPLHDHCVVRGKLIGATTAWGIRRLAIRDSASRDDPTLTEMPRHWLALDADGIPLGDGIPRSDLVACAASVMEELPTAFGCATAIIQATAGHGIKPGARLRLWFWCDRAISGDEAKRLVGRAAFRCGSVPTGATNLYRGTSFCYRFQGSCAASAGKVARKRLAYHPLGRGTGANAEA